MLNRQNMLDGIDIPVSPEEAAELYVRELCNPSNRFEHTQALERILELDALDHYSWLDLATICLSWENDVHVHLNQMDGDPLDIPVFPLIPLAKILDRRDRDPNLDISLPLLFSPSTGMNNIHIQVEEGIFRSSPRHTDILKLRTAEELRQTTPEDDYLPTAERYLGQWSHAMGWVEKQVGASLLEAASPKEKRTKYLGSKALSFGRSVIALRDTMAHYVNEDTSVDILEKMERGIQEAELPSRDKFQLAMSFAVFSIKFALSEISTEKKSPSEAESLLMKLGNYPLHYRHIFAEKISMEEKWGVPVFFIKDSKVHAFLAKNDSTGARFDSTRRSLIFPLTPELQIRVDQRKREKLDFLYHELCDAFFWSGDPIAIEILAHLTDKSDIAEIRTTLLEKYDFPEVDISRRLAYVEALFEAWFDAETLVALLFLTGDGKWESMADEAPKWQNIIAHLEYNPECIDIREIYVWRTRKAVETPPSV